LWEACFVLGYIRKEGKRERGKEGKRE